MKNISPIDRIYCALDTQSLTEALLLADLLDGEVGGIKLGKEFFTANGPEGVNKVAALGHKIFLDLKYHDIPTTVSGAIHAATSIQCEFVTVHASGGACMLEAAIEAATETGLPIWVGLSCESHDGQLYLGIYGRHAGETIADAVIASSSPNVKAICIMHSPPQVTADALRELKACTSLPMGAYAHGGSVGHEMGLAKTRSQEGQMEDYRLPLEGTDPEQYLDYAYEWVACGATIIGGCCGPTPEHIRALTNSNLRDASY